MTVLNDPPAAGGKRGRRVLAFLSLAALVACAGAAYVRNGAPRPVLYFGAGGAPTAAAESYVLPITAPLDQGESGLCWVFAALSMLETNYMTRHPGAHVEFSRAALQRDAIADRFRRLIRGEPGEPSDGGLAVEALDLVRQNGLIDRDDFHDIVDAVDIFASLKETLAEEAERTQRERELDDELTAALGEKPTSTHLDGRPVSPAALASAALNGEAWTEFDLARDGAEGWGPSRDPDALADTRVRYVALDALIDLIHKSLTRGEAVVVGTDDHAMLVYGADYDPSGKPLDYLVKDSLAPYLYRADAETLHRTLNDVTVAVDGPRPDDADNRAN